MFLNPLFRTLLSPNRSTNLNKYYFKMCGLVYYCAPLKAEFENVAPERPLIKITNFRVNCFVLVYKHLVLGIAGKTKH